VLKKKIWANFQRIIELFTQKIVKKVLKIWSWDPGSEIRDPGVQKAPDPGSGSATLLYILLFTGELDYVPFRSLLISTMYRVGGRGG
jgi:hypothetical protein